MQYNLVRDETQELYRLGKEMKKYGDANRDILHQLLSSISTAKPTLSIEDLATWIGLCNKHKLSVPKWMSEAYLEGITLSIPTMKE